MSAPARSYGDVVLQTRPDGRVDVLAADHHVLICEPLLAEIELGYGCSGIELVNDVLQIRGANRTIAYRLGDFIPERRAFAAELIEPPADAD